MQEQAANGIRAKCSQERRGGGVSQEKGMMVLDRKKGVKREKGGTCEEEQLGNEREGQREGEGGREERK